MATTRGPSDRAANYGWPFCYIKQEPYIEWTFPNGPSGEAFDCENGATNASPNNTGIEVLPPATERTICYPYCPYTAPPPFPEIPSGNLAGGQNWGCGRAAFMGDIYHYDADLDAEGKFPDYYDGRPFLIEWERDVIASITMEDGEYVAGSLEEFAFRWRFDNSLRFRKPHDVQFGPDGNTVEWSADGEDWTELDSLSVELEDAAFGLYATRAVRWPAPRRGARSSRN